QHVLAQGQALVERRPLVMERDARPLGEHELAALVVGLAVEDPQQRRLAGAVRSRERDPLAALDLERDAVEELPAGKLLAELGCDDQGHADRVESRGVGGLRGCPINLGSLPAELAVGRDAGRYENTGTEGALVEELE